MEPQRYRVVGLYGADVVLDVVIEGEHFNIQMPVSGSRAFAVYEGHALFGGGYEDRDTYHLFSLGPRRKPELLAENKLRDKNGDILVASRIVGRGDAIHLVSEGFLYRVTVPSALAEWRLG
jgi:hypothetical protein